MASTGFQPIHPRKLYAKLLGIASADERAQATLDFLCGCTASARGHLFLVRNQVLCPAASSGHGPPPDDLVMEVARTWGQDQESEPDANRTRTVDLPTRARPETPLQNQLWTSLNGVRYIRHVLGTYHGTRWIPVGVAMLEAGEKFIALRQAYVEVVCNAFIAAGDVPDQPLDSQ